MMSLKFFGSICILAFGLLASVSATNSSSNATTVAPTTAVPTAAPTTAVPTAALTTAVPPTAAPTTAAPTPAPTTAVPPTAAPTTAAPTPAPNQGIDPKETRIDMKTRITEGLNISDVQDTTKEPGKGIEKRLVVVLFDILKKIIEELIRLVITAFRPGSVIVEYYLVLNTTSEAEAAKIANAATEAINSGQIGNYTVDSTYKPEVYITRKVKASDVSTAPDPTTTTVSTALLIILGVALFILLVIIIILVVLVFCLIKIKKNERKQ